MEQNFDLALEKMLTFEGGYVEHPENAGGPTNQGITLKTFRAVYGSQVTAHDLKNIQPSQVRRIYYDQYWLAANCDELPSGIDFAVFDAAVHSGADRAAKWLQGVMGLKQDGVIGPITLTNARSVGAVWLLDKFCDVRLKFLKGLKNYKIYGNGWARRVTQVHAISLQLISDAKQIEEEPEGDSEPVTVLELTKEEAALLCKLAQKIQNYHQQE